MRKTTKGFIIGLLAAIGISALAVGVQKYQVDDLIFGRATSTDDKNIEFDTGDGASNKKLTVTDTLDGSFNVNNLTIGDSVAGIKKFIFDIGAGAANPFLSYNNGTGTLQFANTGTGSEADLGSGGGAGGAGGVDLLSENDIDGGFEEEVEAVNITTGWTATTPANFQGDTDQKAFGLLSALFDSTGAETVTSTALTVPDGLKGDFCTLEYYYRGDATGIKIGVYDGADYLDGGTVFQDDLIDTGTDWLKNQLVFTCPSSGTIAVRIETTGDEPAVNFDNIRLGQSSDLRTAIVGNAKFYAGMVINNNTNCLYSLGSSTTYATFPADADCSIRSVDGDATLPGTNIPQIVLPNITADVYRVNATFALKNGGGGQDEISCRIVDDLGTSIASQIVSITSGGDEQVFSLEGKWEPTAGSRTVSLQCRNDRNVATMQIDLDYAGADQGQIKFDVYKYTAAPTKQTTVELSPELSDWRIDSKITGAGITISADQPSYEEISFNGLTLANNGGTITPNIACANGESPSGATCIGNEVLGISFSAPWTGAYEICQYVSTKYDAASDGQFASFAMKVAETEEATDSILVEKGNVFSTFESGTPIGNDQRGQHLSLCGIYDLTANDAHTFKSFWYHDRGTNASSYRAEVDDTGFAGAYSRWTVKPISRQRVAIKLNNNLSQFVTSPEIDVKIGTARINNNGSTATIARQDTGFINSVSRTGLGLVTVLFEPGFFTSHVECSCKGINSNTDGCNGVSGNPASISEWRLATYDASSGANVDLNVSFICVGK